MKRPPELRRPFAELLRPVRSLPCFDVTNPGCTACPPVVHRDRGDGSMVLVSVQNLPSGEYRIAFHETPNCSSPNGFSAGRAWAPAATGKPPQDLLPIQYASAEAGVESELRVAGLRATGSNGVAGRSVVLYAGRDVTKARPDVPNAAVACGVFERARALNL